MFDKIKSFFGFAAPEKTECINITYKYPADPQDSEEEVIRVGFENWVK